MKKPRKATNKNTQKRGGRPPVRSGVTPKTPQQTQRGPIITRTANGMSVKHYAILEVAKFLDNDNNLNKTGAIISEFNINPARVQATVLPLYAMMFQRFKFRSVRVEYVPATSAVVSGQIGMMMSTDPAEMLSGDPEALLRQMYSFQGAKIFNVYDNASIYLPHSSKPDYYCSPDSADLKNNLQGVFYAVIMAPIADMEGKPWTKPFGTFKLHFDCEFKIARLTDAGLTWIGSQGQWSTELRGPADAYDGPEPDYWLSFQTGSEPTTVVSSIIFRYITDTVYGLETGIKYFMKKVTKPSVEGQIRYTLYTTLVGAQRSEKLDLVSWSAAFTGEDTLVGDWSPYGPEPEGLADPHPPIMSVTAKGYPNDDVDAVVKTTDPKYTADAYMCSVSGDVPTASDDVSASVLIAGDLENPETITAATKLTFVRSTGENILKISGWDASKFQLACKVAYSPKGLFSFLFTVTGLIVRVLSTVEQLITVSLKVKRAITGNVDNQLRKVKWNDTFHANLFSQAPLAVKPLRLYLSREPPPAVSGTESSDDAADYSAPVSRRARDGTFST